MYKQAHITSHRKSFIYRCSYSISDLSWVVVNKLSCKHIGKQTAAKYTTTSLFTISEISISRKNSNKKLIHHVLRLIKESPDIDDKIGLF